MSKKWFLTISFILLMGAVSVVYAEPFAVQASSHCMACNDSQIGPTTPRSATTSDTRNYENGTDTRRRVAYYRYDISALKQPAKVFANCYLTLNVNKRDAASSHLYVYALKESVDDISNLVGQSWSTLPGVINDPPPSLGEELTIGTLDTADISPLLMAFQTGPINTWESTAASSALDDVLNADTDGHIILMYICYDPQTSGFEIRSPDITDALAIEPVTLLKGIILRGEITGDKAYNPVPANNSTVSLDLSQLSWTKPDPNLPGGTVTCDVYFHIVTNDPNTDDPNYALPNYGYTTLATGITNNFVPVPGPLVRGKTYRWIVDCHDSGRQPEKAQGFLWSFNTNNIAPVVTIIGGNQYKWLTGDPASATVSLDGTVTDDNYPNPSCTVLWTEVSGPAVTIDPNNVKDITLVLTQTGTYKFKLTANDGALSGSDVVYVYVGATPCDAAKAKPGYAAFDGDLNADCYVNMSDFVVLAQHWLECNSLTPCN
jgi:hypothetical protein